MNQIFSFRLIRIFSFGFLIVLNLIVGVFFYIQLGKITNEITSPLEETRPFLDKIIAIQQATSELDLSLHRVLTGVDDEVDSILVHIENIIYDANKLSDKDSFLGLDHEYLNSFITEMKRLKLGLVYYKKYKIYDSASSSTKELYDIIDEAIIKINKDLNQLSNAVRRQIMQSDENTLTGIHFIRKTVLAFLLLVVLGSFLILLLFNMSLSTNLNKLIISTNKIGEGDLQWRMKNKFNDEFGKLSNAFDAMAEKLFQSNQKIVEQTKKIESLAYYDPLTELPNRITFLTRLEQEVERAKRGDDKLSVLFIDLDDFKAINDVYGHQAGDLVLQEVAKRLLNITRISDVVARLAGDEFTVLLTQQVHPVGASIVGERLQEGLKRPFNLSQRIIADLNKPFLLEDDEVSISCSIGIAVFPENGVTAQELVNSADAAMYGAKNEGKNIFRFCTEEMTGTMTKLRETEKELRSALANDEFSLDYQPRIALSSGQIVSLEALIRWNHPQRGVIPPSNFIPLAEERGIIHDISKWALKTVCEQQEVWRSTGCRPVPVMVNISPRDFHKHGIDKFIFQLLDEHEQLHELLGIEITENCLVEERENTIIAMSRLKEAGIKIALDDFGTGHSSLNYLKFLPLDLVNIDRSFLHDINNDRRNVAITQSIISVAHALDLKVVAEGVETDQQHEFLRQNQCDYAQGYLFHKPLSAEIIAELLHESHLG